MSPAVFVESVQELSGRKSCCCTCGFNFWTPRLSQSYTSSNMLGGGRGGWLIRTSRIKSMGTCFSFSQPRSAIRSVHARLVCMWRGEISNMTHLWVCFRFPTGWETAMLTPINISCSANARNGKTSPIMCKKRYFNTLKVASGTDHTKPWPGGANKHRLQG